MNKEKLKKIRINIEARIIDEKNIGYLRNKYSPHLMDTINLYNEVIDLQYQLEEKDKIIEETIDWVDKNSVFYATKNRMGSYITDCNCDKLYEILKGGKNGK